MSVRYVAICILGPCGGNGVLKPEVSKLEAIQEFPRQISKKQVRGFLGLMRYCRKFIPNYSSLALPLTDLTRKNAPNLVEWSSSFESAFQQLKELLCQTPTLWALTLHGNFCIKQMLPSGL